MSHTGIYPIPFDATESRALVHAMLRIRRFEEACAELYGLRKIRGFLHLYIGEEAVATGVIRALRPEDAVVATYREHGHALVRGVPAELIMAEMFGKSTGCSRGRGGSMHLFHAPTRFYGGNAIVGGGLPLAVGLALADKMQHQSRVTACFFGEGAIAEGAFHEAMNLAALWQLPVLFCCENNGYAMGTALERSQSQTDLCARAHSYNMPALCADGMDIVSVVQRAREAIAEIHSTSGPVFLECRTYRFRAHSMFDPELYRPKAEVELWKQRGPLHTFTDRLKAQGLFTEADFAALERDVATEVRSAIDFAEQSPLEPVENLLVDVLTPQDAT
jgi:pyruvate dehydrogenase E1 component alpha subunit